MYWGMGIQHYFANDNAAAAPAFEAALALYRKVGDRTQEGWAMHQLGSTLLKLGRIGDARSLVSGGLRLFTEAGDVAGVTLGLDDLAAVAVAEDDLPRAARLSGLARRLQDQSGTDLAGIVLRSFEVISRPNVANLMAADELARYEAEGAAMSMADGVRYAVGEAEPA